MKNLIVTIVALMCINTLNAQNINWLSTTDNNRMIYLNFGYDFGLTTQLGYAHKLKSTRPIVLSADYSLPMGKNLVDDFKTRAGCQIAIYNMGDFMLAAKAFAIFRRHETNFLRIASFGTEISGVLGYYKPKWHLAFEYGFDKSIASHLKHPEIMKENYAAISDGWFTPSGGQFFYGIQGSKAIKEKLELSLRMGATNAQFDDRNALLPYYAQLGLLYKI